jgi:hypothetical protein
MEKVYNPLDNINDALSADFNFWTISEKGDIGRPDRSDVLISAEELLDTNWLTQEIGKERVSNSKAAEAEFYFVFMEALRRAGYKKITLDVENLHNFIIGVK